MFKPVPQFPQCIHSKCIHSRVSMYLNFKWLVEDTSIALCTEICIYKNFHFHKMKDVV